MDSLANFREATLTLIDWTLRIWFGTNCFAFLTANWYRRRIEPDQQVARAYAEELERLQGACALDVNRDVIRQAYVAADRRKFAFHEAVMRELLCRLGAGTRSGPPRSA